MAAVDFFVSAGVLNFQNGRISDLYGSTSKTPCSPLAIK